MSVAPIDSPERPERHLQAVNNEWSGRTMADEAAEGIVLGMMMAAERSVDEAAEILSSRDFYQPKHGFIYATIIGLWAGNEPTAPMAVARKLDEFGELDRAGGALYLHTLIAKVPTAAGTAAYWARIVLDWAKRRRMREAGLQVVQTAQDVARPIDEVVDAAQRSIHEATVSHQTGTLAAFATFHDEEIDYLEEVMNGNVPQGLTTGLGSLDELLGGFLPGQLIIPAGRPGMGKSTCGLGFAVAAARRGRPAIIHSLEMSRRELTWRLLSAVGGINLTAFTSGKLTRDEHDKAKKTAKTIAEWPLHIDDQSTTVADIRSAARRFRQRHDDLAIVFVDYLQRMRATQKFDRRDLEVGRHASELKTLAQELGTTMIVPSQLNRGPEARSDKRPQLSDMRDSGEIEQEADVVILLHRDDYYDKECEHAGEADFIVAKQRNGPTDTVTVAAQLHLSRFVDFGVTDEPNYS